MYMKVEGARSRGRPRMTSFEGVKNDVKGLDCLVGEASQYLQELCVPLSGRAGRQNLRSSSRGELFVPRYRTSLYGRRSFSVAAPSLWNSLPVDVRQLSGNPEQFKKKLKTVLFL